VRADRGLPFGSLHRHDTPGRRPRHRARDLGGPCETDDEPCGDGAGICRGGECCFGCFDGSSCAAGDTPAACGLAGEMCGTCDPGSICRRGVCEAIGQHFDLTPVGSHVVDTGEIYSAGANNFAQRGLPEVTSLKDVASGPEMGMSEKFKDKAQGSYSMKSCTQMESERHYNKSMRRESIILRVTRTYQMVANIANSYDQVRDNPKCVAAVNLNDPFFQHRDINFILDLEAEEIFEQEINYATVNVRKRRSDGNDFKDAITMGRDYIRQNGTLANLTYARGEDKNSDVYEYKVQWSLKGGKLYPDNPRWTKGDWEGVTLAAPVKPRTIEFEADLDEMRELGVTRATLQVRYQKFGKEVEENIPLTVSKNEPLVEQTIFTDRDMVGYVYRLVLNHKEHGKLALDWEAKINDDYVYAIIPKELRNNTQEFISKLVAAGREMMRPGPDGEVNPKVAILDKFAGAVQLFLNE